jgi:SAM-dependent methyltransferase
MKAEHPWEASFYDPTLFDSRAGEPADERDLEKYTRIVGPLRSGAEVLELGCGTGRVTSHLLSLGLQVYAVDTSDSMLSALRAKLASWLEAKPAKLAVARANALDLDADREFDYALAPDDFLTHFLRFEELVLVLRNVARHLIAGGLFATDTRRRSLECLNSSTSPGCYPIYAHGVVPLAGREGREWVASRSFQQFESDSSILTTHLVVDYLDLDGVVAKSQYRTLRQRLYSPGELSEAALHAGLAYSHERGCEGSMLHTFRRP